MFADFHGVSTPTLTNFRLLTWLTKHRVGKTCLELALVSWCELAQAHRSIRPVTVHAHAHTHTLTLGCTQTSAFHFLHQTQSMHTHALKDTAHLCTRICAHGVYPQAQRIQEMFISCCVPDSGLGLVVNITRSLTWGRWPSTGVDGPSKNHSND